MILEVQIYFVIKFWVFFTTHMCSRHVLSFLISFVKIFCVNLLCKSFAKWVRFMLELRPIYQQDNQVLKPGTVKDNASVRYTYQTWLLVKLICFIALYITTIITAAAFKPPMAWPVQVTGCINLPLNPPCKWKQNYLQTYIFSEEF